MTTSHAAIGQLIAFGLNPRLSPGRNSEYAALVTRYREDRQFRADVEQLTQGLGLHVLDCSGVYGLVLAASGPDSPFHMTLDQYAAMKADERPLNALVFLAIAAASYPTADALELEDGPLPQLHVQQVVQFLDRMAEKVRELRAGEEDPPVEAPQLEQVFRLVLRWREDDETGDARSNPHVKTGMVRRALKWLAQNGMAEEIPTAKDAFRMRSRFRIHVKDAIGSVGPYLVPLRALRTDATP